MATAVKEGPVESTAVARVESPRGALRLLRPVAEPAAIVQAQNEMRAMVHEALKEGRDFGKIPGTDKPTLLKPGAERVALGFGCYYGEPIIVDKEIDHDRENHYTKRRKQWNNKFQGDRSFVWIEESGTSQGLYRYVVRVQVINRETGQVVGEGVGSCSSMESKYIDRPRDTENTVLKMAHKRAIVAAALMTFGLSDEFTQDVEDLQQNGAAAAEEAEAPAAPPPRPLTIETALEVPLPGASTSWGGKGGTALGLLDLKMLKSVATWLGTKIDEEAQKSGKSDPVKVHTLAATKLVIEFKESEAKKDPSAPAPAAKPAKGGKVEDALKDPKVAELRVEISKLLENPIFKAEDRLAVQKRLEKATDVQSLTIIHEELQQAVELGF